MVFKQAVCLYLFFLVNQIIVSMADLVMEFKRVHENERRLFK